MKKPLYVLVSLLAITSCLSCLGQSPSISGGEEKKHAEESSVPENLATATFGGGCFWCTEAVFQQIKGVHTIVSGYTGGHVDNPTYKQVCGGNTGHAEVIQIKYDPQIVPYEKLLEVHWKSHDPTTLNRQGNDTGTQYRSAIFYHDERQKELAEKYKQKLDASGAYSKPIVTEIVAASKFYAAEEYHQNYYKQNPAQGYCAAIIGPKVEKIRQVFAADLKTE